MAKNIDYPRASLQNSLQLADAVGALGGVCSVETAADKLKKKPSGAFSALISAAAKYGLVSQKEGKLSIQPLYREIKLAYTEDERRQRLRQALMSPPLFQSIATRFAGQVLPVEHFEKLLIREFGVPEEMSSKVATYFVVGARQAGALSPENVVISSGLNVEARAADRPAETADSVSEEDENRSPQNARDEVRPDDYSVSFRGPGLHSTILVKEEGDLLIVDAMLAKVRKALEARIEK